VGLSSSAAAVGGASPYGTGSTTASGSTSVEVSARPSSTSGGPSDDATSSVQFMWQPLSDISYPTITLLASFKVSGSVDIANVHVVNCNKTCGWRIVKIQLFTCIWWKY
jgi:hypothetical protein